MKAKPWILSAFSLAAAANGTERLASGITNNMTKTNLVTFDEGRSTREARSGLRWLPAVCLGIALAGLCLAALPASKAGAQQAALPANDAEAARFLTRSTFGPTRTRIDRLRAIGYAQWFDEQESAPPSLTRPSMTSLQGLPGQMQQSRLDLWWEHAVIGPDQLRQRMAWALSQILVISEASSGLGAEALAMAEYYDVLVRNAFGNYRELLEQVTLSPAMGLYLSVLQNQKGNALLNRRADENFAREVLQLFSIGLVELNLDGTPVLDGNGQPIPTYDQSVVEGFAANFTGWTWANVSSFFENNSSWEPMQNWDAYHDKQPKAALSGVVLPAGQSGETDLAQALDNIAGHPNVAPFLSKQLIMRFVTSNPSPEYVARVASIWNDDGNGERGNLLAVLRAVLLDPEARLGHRADPMGFGKLKEPILRVTALWRAFDGVSQNGKYSLVASENILGQAALRSPSVFNFYSPFYTPPGEMGAAGILAPELEITSHSLITATTNELFLRVIWFHRGNTQIMPHQVTIDTSALDPLANDIPALLAELDVLLLGGQMSAATRQILGAHLTSPAMQASGLSTVREAIYMIAISPEGAVQY
jgi:uncharacterized protein (DUF1800 family)